MTVRPGSTPILGTAFPTLILPAGLDSGCKVLNTNACTRHGPAPRNVLSPVGTKVLDWYQTVVLETENTSEVMCKLLTGRGSGGPPRCPHSGHMRKRHLTEPPPCREQGVRSRSLCAVCTAGAQRMSSVQNRNSSPIKGDLCYLNYMLIPNHQRFFSHWPLHVLVYHGVSPISRVSLLILLQLLTSHLVSALFWVYQQLAEPHWAPGWRGGVWGWQLTVVLVPTFPSLCCLCWPLLLPSASLSLEQRSLDSTFLFMLCCEAGFTADPSSPLGLVDPDTGR